MIRQPKVFPKNIAVSFHDCTLIDYYFSPGLDLDAITSTLHSTLSNVNPIVIDGDKNLRPDSAWFAVVKEITEAYGLGLRSDPGKATFTHAKWSSTIDYVFASEALPFSKCETIDHGISDHSLISIRIQVPRHLSSVDLSMGFKKYSFIRENLIKNSFVDEKILKCHVKDGNSAKICHD